MKNSEKDPFRIIEHEVAKLRELDSKENGIKRAKRNTISKIKSITGRLKTSTPKKNTEFRDLLNTISTSVKRLRELS